MDSQDFNISGNVRVTGSKSRKATGKSMGKHGHFIGNYRGIPRKMNGKAYVKHWYRLCISYPLGRVKGGGWTESIPF